jgi:hypothetical protein
MVTMLLADSVTFLLLSPGAERNPIALALGPLAIPAKVAVALFGLWVARDYIREAVLLTGVIVGAVGFGSNLAVLL